MAKIYTWEELGSLLVPYGTEQNSNIFQCSVISYCRNISVKAALVTFLIQVLFAILPTASV